MYAEKILILTVAVVAAVNGQGFLPQYIQPPPVQDSLSFYQPFVRQAPASVAAPSQSLAHREVVTNAEAEAQLPSHLINPFYKNPRVAEALAKESWFGPGEMLVTDRETQKIPRTRIFSVLKNAGLARRR